MENALFVEISLVVAVAFLLASLMRLLKQPLIISYIFSGLLLGPYFFDAINSAHVLHTVSELGIALLLFIVGIGLNPKEVKEVGWGSAFIGVGQVLLTATATFAIAGAFGFGFVHAAYIAIAMTFSSTIVILKVLSDKEELGHLYGKIAVGFLLVQDLIATGFLIYLSSLGGEQVVWISATQSASWFIIIAAGLWFVARYFFPRISKFLAASQEYLFLFAVAWGFGVSAIVAAAGLSVEVGALMAGVTLSTQIYAQEISGRLRPLRDFFLLFFFVMLGARIDLGIFTSVLAPTIGLSLFVLVVNPLIVMGLSGFYGYTKRTSFKIAMTAGQVSEFSLIFILLALQIGQVNEEIVTLVTMASLITIAGSAYMMRYDDLLYGYVRNWLNIFERSNPIEGASTKESPDIFLFGYARSGHSLAKSFQEMKKNFVVVDYDPEAITKLQKEDIKHYYGDINDPEFLHDLHVNQADMIISAISDFKTSLYLTEFVHSKNPDMVMIAYSEYPEEAARLYESGATYVIMPHFLGSEHVLDMINGGVSIAEEKFLERRDKHLRYLQDRLK